MSAASKSKSKDKLSGKVCAKEKVSVKPQKSNGSSNTAGSAYNPDSGTFHTLEMASSASSPPHHNDGRLKTTEEIDDHSGSSSLGAGAEYDSISNNDSCSGESEDQQKEKPPNSNSRLENIPGSDNDKREKIRQKNEKKHQRQKERRAQELHEKCSGYLMSRKLEILSQQFVAMGFSSERATMALIVNEGRVEESVAWLFEGGEESISDQQKTSSVDSGSNLKIDIAEEFAQIAEMEIKFKCSKQEIERVIVACEGDLDKAVDTLQAQKLEPSGVSPKPEGIGDFPVGSSYKLLGPASVDTGRSRVKPTGVAVPIAIQQGREERDFNYAKVMAGPSTLADSGNRNVETLTRIPPPKIATERMRPQQQAIPPSEKRWAMASSSSPSPSFSIASSLQVAPSPTKVEGPRYVVLGSTEGKGPQGAALREPVIMMQRPQSANIAKHSQPTASSVSTSFSTASGWSQNGVDVADLLKVNGGLGRLQNMSLSPRNSTMQQYYNHQPQYQPFGSSPIDTAGWGASWNKTAGTRSFSASLTVPTSLGLFSGRGSTGTSGSTSPVDWSMGGSMPQCDYRNVDWSMDVARSPPKVEWNGAAGYSKNDQNYDDGWAGMSKMNGAKMMAPSGMFSGLQDVSTVAFNRLNSSSAGSQEWTSPFATKDIFGVRRHFTSSPSL